MRGPFFAVGRKAVTLTLALTFAVLLFCSSVQAADGDPIPPQDIDVDLVGFVKGLATAGGLVVAAIITAYAAFLLVRRLMRWMGRALG